MKNWLDWKKQSIHKHTLESVVTSSHTFLRKGRRFEFHEAWAIDMFNTGGPLMSDNSHFVLAEFRPVYGRRKPGDTKRPFKHWERRGCRRQFRSHKALMQFVDQEVNS